MSLFLLEAEAQKNNPEKISHEFATVTLFDSDPAHLWNRLYAALFLRIDSTGKAYGVDSLDVLLWSESKHLLSEPSHGQALQVLDEFVSSHGERLIQDPVKRALLQHDLWKAFEWSMGAARVNDSNEKKPGIGAMAIALQSRFAMVMQRVALSRQEIDALPDNYAAALASKEFATAADATHPETNFLAPDLFQHDGPWVCLGGNDRALAMQHIGGAGGRSAFFAFLRLPEGRAATESYIAKIRAIDRPWIPASLPTGSSPLDPAKAVNPETPQIPAGTMVALVRQMLLIDDKGELVASHLTESVEFRVYHKIIGAGPTDGERKYAQDFYELILDRQKLFANVSGGLKARGNDETDFGFGPRVELTGKDPFEFQEPVSPGLKVMSSCIMCHQAPGLYSINSIADLFSYGTVERLRGLRVSDPEQEKQYVVKWKGGYYFDRYKKLFESPAATPSQSSPTAK